MSVWTEDIEDQLITLIEERPSLYDVTKRLYSNRVTKREHWREIASQLGLSEKEIRKRWESLRTQYTRYRKQGDGATKTGRQQWIVTRLQFLEPHTKRKENTARSFKGPSVDSESPSEGGSSTEAGSNSPEEPTFFKIEIPSSPIAQSSVCRGEPAVEESLPKTMSNTPRPWAKHARKMPEDSIIEESTSLIRNISRALESMSSHGQVTDEISSYCRTLEHRMRKLPPHTLPHFMHEVDNSLFRYTVGQTSTNAEMV